MLQSTDEYESAIDHLRVLGLPIHSDPPKNWDNLIAMDAILRSTGPTAHILDGGAELYSSMLPSLLLFGYRNLYGINLSFDRSFRRGPIRYSHGDITHTEFPAESFHAITCLSVIEHGVDPEAYFQEASRILKPGGLLITSTDYWDDGIDAKGLTAYGVPVRVFDAPDIRKLISLGDKCGFKLTDPMKLSCQEKCVSWRQLNLGFTFIVLTLRKM